MKILNREKLTNYPYINLIRIRYKDRHDRDKSWVYASRGGEKRPDAVVVVPYHTGEQKLVMIREFRVPLEDRQYGFPAGLVDSGESVATACKRELLEETGLVLTKVVRQSPPIFSSSGLTDESISLVFVECEGRPSTCLNEGSEEIEILLVSREEAIGLSRRDDVKFDVKSWIILERFAATGGII